MRIKTLILLNIYILIQYIILLSHANNVARFIYIYLYFRAFPCQTKLYLSRTRANRMCQHARALSPRTFTRLFRIFFFFFQPSARPLARCLRLSFTVPYLEFANPYLPPHSLTTNFVNGFHSGGFSRSTLCAVPDAFSVSLSSLSPLCSAHRAPLQLPLSSANRFKSSRSHRHAHKTRREEKKKGKRRKKKQESLGK